jgi:hypothetical protein
VHFSICTNKEIFKLLRKKETFEKLRLNYRKSGLSSSKYHSIEVSVLPTAKVSSKKEENFFIFFF